MWGPIPTGMVELTGFGITTIRLWSLAGTPVTWLSRARRRGEGQEEGKEEGGRVGHRHNSRLNFRMFFCHHGIQFSIIHLCPLRFYPPVSLFTHWIQCEIWLSRARRRRRGGHRHNSAFNLRPPQGIPCLITSTLSRLWLEPNISFIQSNCFYKQHLKLTLSGKSSSQKKTSLELRMLS